MGAHDGHRDRMRDKIAESGIEGFQDHEVLEYILFHFVPMRNTNEIAHELIDRFGGFSDVLNADAEHLKEVPGMTRNAALFLSTLPDIFRRYAADTEKRRIKLGGRGSTREYMKKMMYGCPVEEVCAAALDAQDNLIKFEKLASGSGDNVAVPVRKIVEFAMRTKAVSLILAHNHPSGSSRPSQSDIDVTRDVCYVLGGIGVNLTDHLVFSDSGCYSFEDNGIMRGVRNGLQ